MDEGPTRLCTGGKQEELEMRRMNSVAMMVLALSLGATIAIADQNDTDKSDDAGRENATVVETGDESGTSDGEQVSPAIDRSKRKKDRQGRSRRRACFIDEDGDGFNDLAPDADGDGIPNGLDSDYVRPKKGVNNSQGRLGRLMSTQQGARFVRGRLFGRFAFGGAEKAIGPDCRSPRGSGPRDGSGFGPGNGTCPNLDRDSDSRGRRGGPRDRGSRR